MPVNWNYLMSKLFYFNGGDDVRFVRFHVVFDNIEFKTGGFWVNWRMQKLYKHIRTKRSMT